MDQRGFCIKRLTDLPMLWSEQWGKRLRKLGLIFDDMEGAVFDPVAQRNRSAHPDALPLRGGDLVADSLAGDLALELGEAACSGSAVPCWWSC